MGGLHPGGSAFGGSASRRLPRRGSASGVSAQLEGVCIGRGLPNSTGMAMEGCWANPSPPPPYGQKE